MTVAFVAGATGFVGRQVVGALRARGVTTIAHVRPTSKRLDGWRETFAGMGAEVDTSPWEPAALAEAMRARGVTHVFVAIGTTRKQAKADGLTGDPYEQVDHALTRMLCEAAAQGGTSPRIVYLSSVGAGPGARTPYLKARWRAEDTFARSLAAVTVVDCGFCLEQDEELSFDTAAPLRNGATLSTGDRIKVTAIRSGNLFVVEKV